MGPGPGIAAVTTVGYFGFLIGPPVIGLISEFCGLSLALSLVAILGSITAVWVQQLSSHTFCYGLSNSEHLALILGNEIPVFKPIQQLVRWATPSARVRCDVAGTNDSSARNALDLQPTRKSLPSLLEMIGDNQKQKQNQHRNNRDSFVMQASRFEGALRELHWLQVQGVSGT